MIMGALMGLVVYSDNILREAVNDKVSEPNETALRRGQSEQGNDM